MAAAGLALALEVATPTGRVDGDAGQPGALTSPFYIGMFAALALQARPAPGEADLELVTPENFMVYQPLLPEAASGALEPDTALCRCGVRCAAPHARHARTAHRLARGSRAPR